MSAVKRGPDTAATRLSRLLALVPWLSAHEGVTIDEAAAHFDVTPDQLQNDLWLLICTGRPGHQHGDLVDIQFWDEDGRITVVDAQTLDRPLRLSPDEAASLLVALRVLAQVPGPHDRAALAARHEQARGGRGGGALGGRRRRRRRVDDQRPGGLRGGHERPRVRPRPAPHLRRRARRAHRARRRPDARAHPRRPDLPRGLVPPGRGGPDLPPRPDRGGGRARRARRGARRTPPRSTSGRARCAPRGTPVTLALAPGGLLDRRGAPRRVRHRPRRRPPAGRHAGGGRALDGPAAAPDGLPSVTVVDRPDLVERVQREARRALAAYADPV